MSQSDLHAPDDLLALHATGEPLPGRHGPACRELPAVPRRARPVGQPRRCRAVDQPGRRPAGASGSGVGRHRARAGALEHRDRRRRLDSRLRGAVRRRGAPRRARRRWSTSFLVAASVAGLLGGRGGAPSVADTFVSSEPAPVAAPSPSVVAPSVVAETQLAALPEHQGERAAEIVETATRARSSSSTCPSSASGEGFYEVWLIDPETFAMVGLGALTDGVGTVPDPRRARPVPVPRRRRLARAVRR